MKAFFMLSFVLFAVVRGATYYVTGTGNDANACSTSGAACAKVSAAVAKGNNSTIDIASGSFTLDSTTFINSTRIGFIFSGAGPAVTNLTVDIEQTVFALPPLAGAFLTIQRLALVVTTNRTVTMIALAPENGNVTITGVIVTQKEDLDISGVDLISISGGNVLLNDVFFQNFVTNTIVIYAKEPINNQYINITNCTFANIVANNVLYYDYGWNNNVGHPTIRSVLIENITVHPDPRPFGGVQHPGLIDVDLIYCDQKTFEISNCTLKNLDLGFSYAAPLYFSAEWEQPWAVPIFVISNVVFQNNSARESGGVGVNMAMTKDYLRFNITDCKFYNNTGGANPGGIKWPGVVNDLFLGGFSHAFANISNSCSTSCAPRADESGDNTNLPDCTDSGPKPVDGSCPSFRTGTIGVDNSSCNNQECPATVIQNAVNAWYNATIDIGRGVYECPMVVVNSINVGYTLQGAVSPNFNWSEHTHLFIDQQPRLMVLLNYPGLFLNLFNLHFEWRIDIPEILLGSASMFGLINVTNVSFSQFPLEDRALRVAFIEMFKGEISLTNCFFVFLQSDFSIITHTSFSFNYFNATNCTFADIQLTQGQAHVFNDLESEEDGLAFHMQGCLVENITRERSGEHGFDFALFEFSGSAFSADFTPAVNFTNCTFRNNYIVTDSLILFDVPKEPIFTNVTFTNNTARYAGCITARATGAFVRLYGCEFYNNHGSYPQESFNDVNIGQDAMYYVPQDIRGSCSRSCLPRITFIEAWFLPTCNSSVDKDGQGGFDNSTCPPFFADLYVSTTGNDTNNCNSTANACASIFRALFAGMNNRIHFTAGNFTAVPVVISDVQGGFALIGNSQFGSETRSQLTLGFTEHLFDLRDYPGVYLFLEKFRLYLNVSSNTSRYIINIGTTEALQGFVNVTDIVITHAETAEGCNFISMDNGIVILLNVLFHGLATFRPLILCTNHRFFGNNTLYVHNVTIGNVTLRGRSTLFDSGGFYHENYTLLLLENFTSTIETNFTVSGLFLVGDDVAIFNFTNCTLRNLYLGSAYQAPIVYHNITEDRFFNFINVVFTNNTAEFAGGIMMHETSINKLRIFFCEFFNNTALSPAGANDIYFDWDKGLYTPFDIGMSCSRSCAPRINHGPFIILPNCPNDSDRDGKGKIDNPEATCQALNSTLIFVETSNSADTNLCLSVATACKTIAGGIAKGFNNMVYVGPGSYEAPAVTLNFTNKGYAVMGDGFPTAPLATHVYINLEDPIFTLANEPGVWLWLIRLRFVLNTTHVNPLITVKCERDFKQVVEMEEVTFTQQNAFAFVGSAVLDMQAGDLELRNVSIDGLVGDDSLIKFWSNVNTTVDRTRFNYRVGLVNVNITNIRLSGAHPLFDDDDENHTEISVRFYDVRVENINATGGTAGKYGLFNFDSSQPEKGIDLANCTFRRLQLGSAFLAPFFFNGVFGGNRMFMNTTFSHNTALHCGGISDTNELAKITLIFCYFFDNHASGAGGTTDLKLGTLTSTYGPQNIIACCGNSGQPRISAEDSNLNNLLGYCEEPLPPDEQSPSAKVVKKTSAGVVVTIVILVLLVIAGAAVGIAIFVWYRKKKNAGYQFIGPEKRAQSVNNDFEVEGRK